MGEFREQVDGLVVGDAEKSATVGRGEVDFLEAAAARRDERDPRIERPRDAGYRLEHRVGEAPRHLLHVARSAGKARAEHPALLGDVEHQRLDRDLAAADRHRALDQEIGVERAPVAEVEFAQVVARVLRVLDIRLGRDDGKEAAEFEVVAEHPDEVMRDRALVVAAEVLELRNRDRRDGRARLVERHV